MPCNSLTLSATLKPDDCIKSKIKWGKPVHEFIHAVDTCWKSEFDMFKQLMEQIEPIAADFYHQMADNPRTNTCCYQRIQWMGLSYNFFRPGEGKVFARNLLKDILSRFPDYRQVDKYLAAAAMLLDPQFKAVLFKDHEEK
ncbi:hypothetical protein PR048_010298 [Dryococelus australis]|uniref:Uncharacterized protein n=1 Tax=Dryococelus australis TaxID=614101 RepID=A0ABQ9I2C0_9NEOP|nr:hypothetical protein PR048_010298 [Dryococelus australis]